MMDDSAPYFDPGAIINGIRTYAIWSSRRSELLAQFALPNDSVPRAPIYCMHLERSPVLAYIDQTGDLRRRMNEPKVSVYADAMPFTTPHIAAPLTTSFVLVLEEATAFSRESSGWGGPTSMQESHKPRMMPVGDLDDTQDACADIWGGHTWSSWRYAGEKRLHPEERGLYQLWERSVRVLFFLGRGYLGEAARHAARTNARLLFSAVCGNWTSHSQQELLTDFIDLYVCQRKALSRVRYGGIANRKADDPWTLEVEQ